MDYVPTETQHIISADSVRSIADWMLLAAAGFSAVFVLLMVVLAVQIVRRRM